MLNLKPVVSFDSEGKGVAFGKSFSRRGDMKKIMRMIKDGASEEKMGKVVFLPWLPKKQ